MDYRFSDRNFNDVVTLELIIAYRVSDRNINTTVLRNEQLTPV